MGHPGSISNGIELDLPDNLISSIEKAIYSIASRASLKSSEDILTTDDVAKEYKVSRREVLHWAGVKVAGTLLLPHYEYGRMWHFRRSDVDRFIERLKITGAQIGSLGDNLKFIRGNHP